MLLVYVLNETSCAQHEAVLGFPFGKQKGRPYNCDECHRSFGTDKRLKNHKVEVHQRVKCEECGKEICNAFNLKRHKAIVHGIQPKNVFHCEKCPLFFATETSLDKHTTSKHDTNNL